MRLRPTVSFLALSTLLLTACGGGSSPKTQPLGPVGTKGWTVLVYMTADNNLEGDALKDLAEMASIDSGADLRFVVQADRAVGQAAGAFLNAGDWTTVKRFVVRRGVVQDQVDLGELDMGLTATLSDFVTWGLKTYPGERYMLVFWDHGGGWKGFGWDDSAMIAGEPDHLSLDRIAAGVQAGLAGTTVPKFDMIGFDACLMATIEVAESVKPYANYLLASEETEPGHGWDWAAFGGGGLLAPIDLGKKVIDGFWAQSSSAPWNDVAGVTLSLVDLGMLGPIETAMTSLATAYPNATLVGPVLGSVASGRQKAVEYASNPDPRQAYQLVDAWHLFSGMSGVTGASAMQTAIAGAVVYERHGQAKEGSHGLSIYFPVDNAYYNSGYDALPGMGAWRTFLTAVYGGGTAQVKPSFISSSESVVTGGLTVSGGLDGATTSDLSKAYLIYGLDAGGTASTPGGAVMLGDQPATVSGTNVTSTWDWSIPQISQGAYRELGYVSFEVLSNGVFNASFPMAYEASPGAALDFAVWQLSVNSAGALLANNVFLYSGGGVAQLNPAPGSRLRALVRFMPAIATTWSFTWKLFDATAAGFDATQPLAIDFPVIPAGYIGAAVLRAENAAEEGSWVYSYYDAKP
jgi:Clostripain family